VTVGVEVGAGAGVSVGAGVEVGIDVGVGGTTTSKVILRTVLPPVLVTWTVTVSKPGESGAVYIADAPV
jgi:hypothetical protein